MADEQTGTPSDPPAEQQGTSTPFGVTAVDPMGDEDRDPIPAPPGTEEGDRPQVRQIAEGIEATFPAERHALIEEED
jgi:hypothetical protein